MASFLPHFEAHNHVHASHYLELHGSLTHKRTSQLESTARVVDIAARARGGVLLAVEIQTFDPHTTPPSLLCTQEWTSMVLRVPAVGCEQRALRDRGSRTANYAHLVQAQLPDVAHEYVATPEMAALYRAASGDLNPLHIDPETAKKAGFQAPILTGTCTLGVGARIVADALGGGRKVVGGRWWLRRPMFAGDKVRVEMWRVAEKDVGVDVVYRMVVIEVNGKERTVVDGAGVAFEESSPGGTKL
jgi:peroxisomal enoyl-CoA hydratase 2